AFGCLLDDLLQYMEQTKNGEGRAGSLYKLRDDCLNEKVAERPTFERIHAKISEVEIDYNQ
ncbi:MAG TPA: hypothetical protein VF691_14780, partial [Cytophagaceae bacterium]